MIVKQKAYALITKDLQLLVFKQPDFPEAGTQIPGGTIEPGETPAQAVMREAQEETGLGNLILTDFLGETEFNSAIYGKEGIHHRYFYHLACPEAPSAWTHGEFSPSEGENESIVYEFYWLNLAKEEELGLVDGKGYLVDKLRGKLGLD